MKASSLLRFRQRILVFIISLSLLCLQRHEQRCVVIAASRRPLADMIALQFRAATPKDVQFARKTMFQQAMNPLSISKKCLLVAYDDDDDDESINTSSRGATEASSDAAAAAAVAVAPNGMLGFGQIRPLDDTYSELASLYVLPQNRGKGIGGSLVQELLSRHDEKKQEAPDEIVLLTLRPTTPLYTKYGFEILDSSEIPSSLQFEYKAGSIVSAFLGNDLVCMKRTVEQD